METENNAWLESTKVLLISDGFMDCLDKEETGSSENANTQSLQWVSEQWQDKIVDTTKWD